MIGRAFIYGDLIFESMRVEQRVLNHGARHFQRLVESSIIMKFNLAPGFTEEKFTNEILQSVDLKGLKSARVRFILYRDGVGFYTPQSSSVNYEIQVEALSAPRADIQKMGVFTSYKKPCNLLSNLKSGNALIYVMAGMFAKENGFDDCFVLNEQGNIAEAISANVFVVKDKMLYTPSLAEGCINGVMRNVVLDKAREAGIPVLETTIDSAFAENADEIFLTNASNGITSVWNFNGRNYKTELTGKLKNGLIKTFIHS